MKKQTFSILSCLLTVILAVLFLQPVIGNAASASGMVLVSADGQEIPTADPLNAFSGYSYVKLYADANFGTMDAQTVWVDLNGNDLSVAGTGKLYVFDSANDTYDAAACGVVKSSGTVEIAQDVQAPNEGRYLAVQEDDGISMHRLDMILPSISLRTTAAGLYYKAVYNCDDTLAAKAKCFGVVLSIDNMPGEDFLTETKDINRYTTVAGFRNGAVATSGSVFGIMKEGQNEATNAANGETPIYANPYVYFDLNGGTVCVGDTENADKVKTDEGFDGHAYSLHNVMDILDNTYYDYGIAVRKQIDDFYLFWKDKGMAWSFANIGKTTETVDNSNLGEDPDYCPVCKKTVTWEMLTDDTQGHLLQDGQHYYLTKPLTYTGTDGNGFILAPGANETACLHLNGQSITATKDHAIYGNSGVLNVMGEGVVSGYTNTAHYGGAVQVNNTYAESAINLYGGTYQKTDDSADTAASIFIRHNGGAVNLYRGVQVGTGDGEAICVGKSNYRDSVLEVLGAEVKGDIYLYGANPENGNASRITLIDATVTGTVQVNANNDVTLSGKLSLGKLSAAEDVLVTIKALTQGTTIGVDAEGIFTQPSPSISKYLTCFTPVQTGYAVTVKNDALRCSVNYMGELKLTDGQAYCPVCQQTVTWTALTDSSKRNVLENGQHYYLTESLTYTGTSTSFIGGPATGGHVACLHLNGHDITATKTYALYAGSGTLNVMGSGTVTGKAHADYRYGGALVCNNTGKKSEVNLYSGTYKSTDDSVVHTDGTTAYVLTVRNNGGKLNLYEDVTVEGTGTGSAIYVGTSKQGNSNLSLNGATVKGNVLVRKKDTSVGTFATNITVDSAVIAGTVKIEDANVDSVILQGRPVIGQLTVPEGFLVTLEELKEGTNVMVDAAGTFTNETENAQTWANWFTAAGETDWIVVREKALCCTEKQTLSNGKKVIFLGNSRTYYGKCVLEKGQTVYSQKERSNDQGYFYQICKANGVDVSVTNYTFGGHSLVDFYSEDCQADRGHNGHNHLADITDWNYDYVILQDGSRSNNEFATALEQCRKLMELFRAGNPNTKFVYLVHNVVHSDNYVWRSTIKELEDAGILVVDWGELVDDLINGVVTIPNGTQTCSKYSFIVNKSETDGHHPNVLTGYITAQMLYCALTGESAVGQDYSFWNDPKANAAFDMETYKQTYYAYDVTVDSGTNFEAIFSSKEDMTGLQKLMDQYFAAKGYREY